MSSRSPHGSRQSQRGQSGFSNQKGATSVNKSRRPQRARRAPSRYDSTAFEPGITNPNGCLPSDIDKPEEHATAHATGVKHTNQANEMVHTATSSSISSDTQSKRLKSPSQVALTYGEINDHKRSLLQEIEAPIMKKSPSLTGMSATPASLKSPPSSVSPISPISSTSSSNDASLFSDHGQPIYKYGPTPKPVFFLHNTHNQLSTIGYEGVAPYYSVAPPTISMSNDQYNCRLTNSKYVNDSSFGYNATGGNTAVDVIYAASVLMTMSTIESSSYLLSY
ncbi:hypothetical protein V1511DRAFT_511689 [Dipodascopsis uninucleata]